MTDKDILDNFGTIWPRHVLSLTKFLIAARRSFDGDIDLFLVLCVVGERTFSQRHLRPDLDYARWSSQSVNDIPSEDINIQSIADFSGIPRETVRRKLGVLIDKGWVERDEHGLIRATARAKAELEPLTKASLHYLSEMKATLLALR